MLHRLDNIARLPTWYILLQFTFARQLSLALSICGQEADLTMADPQCSGRASNSDGLKELWSVVRRIRPGSSEPSLLHER
jgi:hypothetical protein